jgi:quercetin dioxygenase-like cupin family protein
MSALLAALVLGGVIGMVGDRLANDSGPMRATETVVRSEGTLETLPPGPVTVRAETVRLPAGFQSTHVHGGPTFNIVESGKVEIVEGGRAKSYGPGELFLEPAGREHTIRVVETATLSVIRLLPPGAEETTETQ